MPTTAYQSSYTGAQIDEAVGAVLTNFDASNTNTTSGTSDNVTFTKSSIVFGINGCTIQDSLGALFYFARTDRTVETLTYSSWDNVAPVGLYNIFIDATKLVREGRVTSIVGCTVASGALSQTTLSRLRQPTRYIRFAYIHKGNIFPDGVFAKPEFVNTVHLYSGTSAPTSDIGDNGDIYIQTS